MFYWRSGKFKHSLKRQVIVLGIESYYDDLKESMSKQADINRSEFQSMEDEARVQYEGFRAGMYVRIEVNNKV